MSSTSSSECLCGDCFQYGANFQDDKPRTPFYQTLGDPLIYYAQVHSRPCSRSKELRKTSPNCFVKAFRWYTQEHRPQTQMPRQNDITGFAVWLDQKYEEFLQNKQTDDWRGIHQRKLSTFETENVKTSVLYKSRRKKIFARAKSPWKKRQRNVKSKECDCTLDKCSHSLEYIMKPKDLSRATSECCNNRRTAGNRSRSKVSISSFEIHASRKTLIKSLNSDKNACENVKKADIDLNKIEGSIIRTPSSHIKSNIKVEHVAPKASAIGVFTKDTFSQYPAERLITRNVATQYYETDFQPCSRLQAPTVPAPLTRTASEVFALNESKNEPLSRRIVGKRNVEAETDLCQCPQLTTTKVNIRDQPEKIDVGCCCTMDCKPNTVDQALSSYMANDQTCCVNCSVRKMQDQRKKIEPKSNTYVDQTKKQIIKKSTNDYVQTSDRAINLENSGVCKYPFFMKIVCSDKLKVEAQK